MTIKAQAYYWDAAATRETAKRAATAQREESDEQKEAKEIAWQCAEGDKAH